MEFDLRGLPFFWPLVIAVVLAGALMLAVVRKWWEKVPGDAKANRGRFRILCAIFVASAFSLFYAAYEAYAWNPTLKSEASGIADVPYSSCVVFGFPDAQSFADTKTNAEPDPSKAELADLQQDPPGCIDKLRRWMRTEPPAQINIYGRADRRPLSAEARKKVTSNEVLAHKRALAVADWIADVEQPPRDPKDEPSKEAIARKELLMARTHVDVAGVRYANTRNAQALEQDRSVDIEAFWPRQLPINSAVPATTSVERRLASVGLRLNAEGMDPGVALAVLSLFVALSAYLATVGFFMRERASELKRRIDDVNVAIAHAEKPPKNEAVNEEAVRIHKKMKTTLEGRKAETVTHLELLPIADLPMIVAALLLALHLFFFISTAWLRVSIVFATFAAMVLVMQHAGVWFTTVMRIFKPERETTGSAT